MKEERKTLVADLHIHTPSSRCFKGDKSDNTYINILKVVKNKKISIIAITDHNSIEGYKKIIELRDELKNELSILQSIDDSVQASKKRKELTITLSFFDDILIIPGVEFEVNNGIHLLCLFNPETPISDIQDFLKNGGYDKDDYGFESATKISKWDIFSFFEETKKYDCIVIDAHTDSDKGILETIKNGLPRAHCLSNSQLKGLCYKSEKQRSLLEKTFENSIDYQREIPLAFLKSSDAHSLDEIGRDTTYFQLPKLNFEEFKKSFNNPLEYISTTIPAVKNIVERIVQTKKVIFVNEIDFNILKQYLCALNNSTGGFILLGVNELGGITGYPTSEFDKLYNNVIDKIESLPQKIEFDINPYPVQNAKFIIVINIKKGWKLIDVENDGIIWVLDSKKVKKLSAREIEQHIEKKLTAQLQKKITPRLKKIESDSSEIKNILYSFPIIQKFEQSSIGIYSLITEPAYKKSLKLTSEQNSTLEAYVKSKNNGKTKGNIFYFEGPISPRLNNAYLRISIPKYYLKGVTNHTNRNELIIVVPGGAVFYTLKSIEHFSSQDLGIIEFISKENNYSNKIICSFLKSSFFLWYFKFKFDTVDFFPPNKFKYILLPNLNLKNPKHVKITNQIESQFDIILEEENNFLQKDLKPDCDDYEETIENHNTRVEKIAHNIDLLFYELIDLNENEIKIIESSIEANNLYIPKNN